MAESIEDREINSWRMRLIWAWVFTIPIAILMLSERILGMSFLEGWIMTLILLILAFPVIFIFGFETIKTGLKGFTSFYFNMDSLIMLGTLIAFITGLFSFIFPIQDYSGISAMKFSSPINKSKRILIFFISYSFKIGLIL